jgi:hypothetical protein
MIPLNRQWTTLYNKSTSILVSYVKMSKDILKGVIDNVMQKLMDCSLIEMVLSTTGSRTPRHPGPS